MADKIDVLNFEAGYPSAEEAKRRLATELALARSRGISVLKIIHGYGSSGKGGKLRTSLRTALRRHSQEGTVGHIVFGEAWSIFEESTRTMLERYPKLREDRDLERGNPGITLVEVVARRSGAKA